MCVRERMGHVRTLRREKEREREEKGTLKVGNERKEDR